MRHFEFGLSILSVSSSISSMLFYSNRSNLSESYPLLNTRLHLFFSDFLFLLLVRHLKIRGTLT